MIKRLLIRAEELCNGFFSQGSSGACFAQKGEGMLLTEASPEGVSGGSRHSIGTISTCKTFSRQRPIKWTSGSRDMGSESK